MEFRGWDLRLRVWGFRFRVWVFDQARVDPLGGDFEMVERQVVDTWCRVWCA